MLNNSRTFLKVTAFHQFNSLRIPCLRLWKKVITFSPLQKIILMEAYISACRLAVEWTLSKIHRRKWSRSQLRDHTICVFHAFSRDHKPLQFGKMLDREQLQLVKELHSNFSEVPYFCCNIPSYTSVGRTSGLPGGSSGYFRCSKYKS